MDNKTGLIPLHQISAVMCNYARPKSARSCVRRLKELGITEIIVWNNGAKPIPEATLNINHKTNKGPIGKYHAGLKTKRPYVLIVDDDHLLTASGLRAFRKWGKRFPAVAQNGSIFEPPFTDYNKRVFFRSHQLKKVQKVDMIQPNMGLLIRTDLYRKLLKHWSWGAQQVIDHRPGIFSTDLELNCAIWDLAKERPVVVPAKPKGYQKLPDEAPDKALMNQKGIYQEKSKALKWLVQHGWKMLKA